MASKNDNVLDKEAPQVAQDRPAYKLCAHRFGHGAKIHSVAIIIGPRAVITSEHALKMHKQLSKDKAVVEESYETDYWIQHRMKKNSENGYSEDDRVNLKLYKVNEENDWALLYRVSGTFSAKEIAPIDKTAINLTEEEYLALIRFRDCNVRFCPFHVENVNCSNEMRFGAFCSHATIQDANYRHIMYSSVSLMKGTSVGGVILDNKLVALHHDRSYDVNIDEDVIPMEFCDDEGLPLPVVKMESNIRTFCVDNATEESEGEPNAKRLKLDSETVATRVDCTEINLHSALILCKCSSLMYYVDEMEQEDFLQKVNLNLETV